MQQIDPSRYNQEQLKAITWHCTPNSPLFISAGAGTGKTSVLTARIQYIIEKGIHPKNILAITFTKLAANEMRERLCSTLPTSYHTHISIRTFHSLALHLLPYHSNEMDFDSMIPAAIQHLENSPEGRFSAQMHFQHILVDEFQDTSPEQWKLLSLLLPPHHNLFAVGDEDQSIYRFRGASPDIIQHIQKVYPSITHLKLQANYRSTPNILHYANTLFPEKSSFTRKILYSSSNRSDSLFKNNSSICVHISKNAATQNHYILKEIYRLKIKFKLEWEDFAILVRLQHQRDFYRNWLFQNTGKHYPINICTIHSSKGLQYPVVFLMGLNNGLFPHTGKSHKNAKEHKDHYLEEKRLFYVGVTRAESLLYLCSCTEYYIQGRRKKASLNSFLLHYGSWKQRYLARWKTLKTLL